MEIIHIVLGKANPERMNGVNKVVYQLATEQFDAGKNVSIWGITKDITHNYGLRSFNTELFKKQKNPFSINSILRKRLLSKKGKAIFHIHGGWIPLFYSISKLLHKNNISFVFTPHGAYNSIAIEKSKLIKLLYFKLFEKKLLIRAHKIHCIGKSEIAGLNTIFKTKKTFLLPYGYEIKKTITNTENSKENIFTIGYLGRIDIHTKGLDLLIDAFKLFNQHIPNSRLWIVGDGGSFNELKQLIAIKNLTNSVVLWGSKFGIEKDELINKFDVFAHPSRNEGLPSAVLEASSFGIPCIVTDATNMGDVIRECNCGETIENDNMQALLNAFIKLNTIWNINGLYELKINSKKMIEEKYNWKKIVEEFELLYN